MSTFTDVDRELGDQTIKLQMHTSDHNSTFTENLGIIPQSVVNLATSDFTGTVKSAALDIVEFTNAIYQLTTNDYPETSVNVKVVLRGE